MASLHFVLNEIDFKSGLMKAKQYIKSGNVDIHEKNYLNKTPFQVITKQLHKVQDTDSQKIFTEIVKLLLQNGAKVNEVDFEGFTPLHNIVSNKNASEKAIHTILEILLKNSANLNAKTKSGNTALHYAAENGFIKIAKTLIDHGAKIDPMDDEGFTPLHNAADFNKVQLLELLLQHGAKINMKTKKLWTPLHLATENGFIEIARILLRNGADINAKTNFGSTPLAYAAEYNHLEIAKILIQYKADLDEPNIVRYTPMHLAAENGNDEIIRILFKNGANIEAKNNAKMTPIFNAINGKHFETVKTLISLGANIKAKNAIQETTLTWAVLNWVNRGFEEKESSLKIINLLMENGATLQDLTYRDLSPLHVAAKLGCVDFAKILIQNSENVNNKMNRDQNSPLMEALKSGDRFTTQKYEMIKLLVQNGATLDIKNSSGDSPLEYEMHMSENITVTFKILIFLKHDY